MLNIRPQDTRQFASAQQIDQLEGLAVAIPWGFESPLPHQLQIQQRRLPIDEPAEAPAKAPLSCLCEWCQIRSFSERCSADFQDVARTLSGSRGEPDKARPTQVKSALGHFDASGRAVNSHRLSINE